MPDLAEAAEAVAALAAADAVQAPDLADALADTLEAVLDPEVEESG